MKNVFLTSGPGLAENVQDQLREIICTLNSYL